MNKLYEKLVLLIVNKFVRDGVIGTADVELYTFGVDIVLLKFIHYFTYFLIAICMNKITDFVIIFCILCAFRRNIGGFHAKTRIGCYLFSCSIIYLSLLATNLKIQVQILIMIAFLSLIVILLLAPVDNKNRRMDAEDIKYYRHRLYIIVIIFCGILSVTYGLCKWKFITLYTIGLEVSMLLMIMGKIQFYKRK